MFKTAKQLKQTGQSGFLNGTVSSFHNDGLQQIQVTEFIGGYSADIFITVISCNISQGFLCADRQFLNGLFSHFSIFTLPFFFSEGVEDGFK